MHRGCRVTVVDPGCNGRLHDFRKGYGGAEGGSCDDSFEEVVEVVCQSLARMLLRGRLLCGVSHGCGLSLLRGAGDRSMEG